LIVFVKNADPGRVKTRLAADLGEQETLKVYLRLVAHTMQQAMGARAVVDIFSPRPISSSISAVKFPKCGMISIVTGFPSVNPE